MTTIENTDQILLAKTQNPNAIFVGKAKIRFTADRSESGHSDRFWALALALHATKQKHQPLSITIGY